MPYNSPEAEREYRKHYRKINKEKITAAQRRWREKNLDYNPTYYQKHRTHLLEYFKSRYYHDREKFLTYQAEYRLLHVEDIRRRKANYMRTRKKNDHEFALLVRLRRRLCRAISAVPESRKSASTMELVGCDLSHLARHIEEQFLSGMSWSNRDLWHIDHKAPCSSFDLTDETQQRACFHWSNLQPLWSRDNIRKGKRTVSLNNMIESIR